MYEWSIFECLIVLGAAEEHHDHGDDAGQLRGAVRDGAVRAVHLEPGAEHAELRQGEVQGVHQGHGEPEAGAGAAGEGPHLPRGRARVPDTGVLQDDGAPPQHIPGNAR